MAYLSLEIAKIIRIEMTYSKTLSLILVYYQIKLCPLKISRQLLLLIISAITLGQYAFMISLLVKCFLSTFALELPTLLLSYPITLAKITSIDIRNNFKPKLIEDTSNLMIVPFLKWLLLNLEMFIL